ncbi:MAG: cell wall hydrolase, partial [Lachnospiraceae bacterium]|nr:cell wall hydrolase [Lachnospiraceae bacterium]
DVQALQAAAAAAEAEAKAAENAAQTAQSEESEDVKLLASLIYCEAGNQPHEGKVAVGSVVMNRLNSPAYPNTLAGVIYASGQFTPARSGKVDRIYRGGNIQADSIAAAKEALAGSAPVGGATHFRRKGNRQGTIIGAHVFY